MLKVHRNNDLYIDKLEA